MRYSFRYIIRFHVLWPFHMKRLRAIAKTVYEQRTAVTSRERETCCAYRFSNRWQFNPRFVEAGAPICPANTTYKYEKPFMVVICTTYSSLDRKMSASDLSKASMSVHWLTHLTHVFACLCDCCDCMVVLFVARRFFFV